MPQATVLAPTSQHLQLDQATRTQRSSQRHGNNTVRRRENTERLTTE
jgi:hypothetical protein